jgi:hypothetical protein
MAQRMRVRLGRIAWVGALAVFCGGLSGCFSPDKDKRPWGSPPQAKGTAGERPTTTGVIDPKTGQWIKTGSNVPGGTTPGSPYTNSTAGTPSATGSITGTAGQYPPGYRPGGPGYDPMSTANPYNPGTINTPNRPTSATQFNSPYPSNNSMVPSVTPATGSYPQPGSGTGATPNYGSPSSSSGYSSGGSTSYNRPDPTPPSLNDLGPVPPAAPSAGLAPPVGPYTPASTPASMMSAPLSPASGGYPPR